MRIILVATGDKGKNVVFVTDTLKAYPLKEAIQLAKVGKFKDVYAVRKGSGVYLRSRRSIPKNEQLEQLTVSSRQLSVAAGLRNAPSTPPALNRYLQLYESSLREKDGPFITPVDGLVRILTQDAKEKLQPHRQLIFEAAERFKVNPYLLAAIIIDEIARFGPFEDITDSLAGYFVGVDTSGGIAQVTTKTARGLIRDGYYNPNPADKKLSPEGIRKASLSHIYTYVKESRHSIFFAAAKARELIDEWKEFVDLNARPEVIATLYHLTYRDPHANPEANPRGLQIAGEFYRLAQEWLVPL